MLDPPTGLSCLRMTMYVWELPVRKFVFVLLLAVLTASLAYGLYAGGFFETLTNGAMICLTCIGVA